MDMASLHLAQRWYLGYALDEPLPDHSSLTRIRTRLGVDIVQRFFGRVVELCQQAGLVWGKELFFGGTKVRANADSASLTPRFAQQAREHVAELFASDGVRVPDGLSSVALSEGAPPSSRSTACSSAPTERAAVGATATPTPLPFTGAAALEQQLAQDNAGQGKLLEQRRLDPKRPPSGPYRRITDFRVSTTDPDAAPMTTGAAAKRGYHDQYVVDGGKARIIVGALVTPADAQHNQAFVDLLDRVRFRHHLHVRRASADSTYATGANLRALAERSTPPRELGLEFDVWTSERLSAYLAEQIGSRLTPGWLPVLLAQREWVRGRPKLSVRHLRRAAEVAACQAALTAADKKGGRRSDAS